MEAGRQAQGKPVAQVARVLNLTLLTVQVAVEEVLLLRRQVEEAEMVELEVIMVQEVEEVGTTEAASLREVQAHRASLLSLIHPRGARDIITSPTFLTK